MATADADGVTHEDTGVLGSVSDDDAHDDGQQQAELELAGLVDHDAAGEQPSGARGTARSKAKRGSASPRLQTTPLPPWLGWMAVVTRVVPPRYRMFAALVGAGVLGIVLVSLIGSHMFWGGPRQEVLTLPPAPQTPAFKCRLKQAPLTSTSDAVESNVTVDPFQHVVLPIPSGAGPTDGQPVQGILLATELTFHHSHTGIVSPAALAVMDRAMRRYCSLLQAETVGHSSRRATGKLIFAIKFMVYNETVDPIPQFPMKESYTLKVSPTAVTIVAPAMWGVLRGLETVSQMITPTGILRMNVGDLHDEPRFGWRGFLVDTSRHFLPMSTLYRLVDALAYSKMNVLHWHVVDAQSFPLQLDSHPEMAKAGAWSPDKLYTKADVKALVSFAADRGIRVVPELDMPAHTAAWGRGRPEVISNCSSAVENNLHGMDKYALNPTLNSTYELVESLLTEFTSLFPDKYIHIGADEVYRPCWVGPASGITSQQARAWSAMAQMPATYENYVIYFMERVDEMTTRLGRETIMWQDSYDEISENAPQHISIEPWKCWSYKSSIQSAAIEHRGVVQAACWYLDYDSTWVDFYSHDPVRDARITGDKVQYVWGGEVTMFAESVDVTNFECRVWPRAAAVAERLWSPADTIVTEAVHRMRAHRDRLYRRGTEAAPLSDSIAMKYAHDLNGRCPSIEQTTQRPLKPAYHTFLQYNIDEAGQSRTAELLAWLRFRYADVVGLCEAFRDDSEGAAKKAAVAGFPYIEIFRTKSNYNVGLMAAHPIKVLERNDEDFERGMIVADIRGIIFIVVHLHAHSSLSRQIETSVVAERVKMYTLAQKPVVVMGDMNTLSPLDKSWHDKEGLWQYLNDERTPDRERNKYMYAGAVDYKPMQNLLDSGLSDMCTTTHWPGDDHRNHSAPSPCLFTEPTQLSMVQEATSLGEAIPPFRLDYALGNRYMLALGNPECAVVQTADTDRLSDHYPIECRFHVTDGVEPWRGWR